MFEQSKINGWTIIMDPFMECKDARRVSIIEKMADSLEDDGLVESGFWAFCWLADMQKLETIADDFIKQIEPVRSLYVESTKWTKTLKICKSMTHFVTRHQSNPNTREHRRVHPVGHRHQKEEVRSRTGQHHSENPTTSRRSEHPGESQGREQRISAFGRYAEESKRACI